MSNYPSIPSLSTESSSYLSFTDGQSTPSSSAEVSASRAKPLPDHRLSGLVRRNSTGSIESSPGTEMAASTKAKMPRRSSVASISCEDVGDILMQRWLKIKTPEDPIGDPFSKPSTLNKSLRDFEHFRNHISPITAQNFAEIMEVMANLKKPFSSARQFASGFSSSHVGQLICKAFGLDKRDLAKFGRVIVHLPDVISRCRDPGTLYSAYVGARLAFAPNLVEGDREAGKQGLESKEVRMTRAAIREVLLDWGFNPATGKLDSQAKFDSRQRRSEAQARIGMTESQESPEAQQGQFEFLQITEAFFQMMHGDFTDEDHETTASRPI
jgi:hypothetical protein